MHVQVTLVCRTTQSPRLDSLLQTFDRQDFKSFSDNFRANETILSSRESRAWYPPRGLRAIKSDDPLALELIRGKSLKIFPFYDLPRPSSQRLLVLLSDLIIGKATHFDFFLANPPLGTSRAARKKLYMLTNFSETFRLTFQSKL